MVLVDQEVVPHRAGPPQVLRGYPGEGADELVRRCEPADRPRVQQAGDVERVDLEGPIRGQHDLLDRVAAGVDLDVPEGLGEPGQDGSPRAAPVAVIDEDAGGAEDPM